MTSTTIAIGLESFSLTVWPARIWKIQWKIPGILKINKNPSQPDDWQPFKPPLDAWTTFVQPFELHLWDVGPPQKFCGGLQAFKTEAFNSPGALPAVALGVDSKFRCGVLKRHMVPLGRKNGALNFFGLSTWDFWKTWNLTVQEVSWDSFLRHQKSLKSELFRQVGGSTASNNTAKALTWGLKFESSLDDSHTDSWFYDVGQLLGMLECSWMFIEHPYQHQPTCDFIISPCRSETTARIVL